MNDYTTSIIVENPKNVEKIAKEELAANFGELLYEGKIRRMSVDKCVGQGYSYESIKKTVEIDGYMHIFQQNSENHANLLVSCNDPLVSKKPNISFDEVYSSAIITDMQKMLEAGMDIAPHLSSLAEYNRIKQQIQQTQNEERGI